MGSSPVCVVYIAGARHCGSTMLDALLGSAPGARSLGEVGGFFRFRDGMPCDCGSPPASCSPCRAVVDRLAVMNATDEFVRRSRQPLKERRAYWAVVGGRGRRRYAELAGEVLATTASVTGATVLVDSSKNMARAAALLADGDMDVRVVHLVRDGRGYLRSRARRGGSTMSSTAPVGLVPWMVKNLLIDALVRRRCPADRSLRIRYEDLIAEPEATMARLGTFTGLDTTGLVERASTVGVPRQHLYEPARRLDYSRVVLEPGRASRDDGSALGRWWYWLAGGFVSRRWGYRLRD